MEQAYAQALMSLIEGGMEPKAALHALRESLKTRGREALLPRIALAFERLAARQIQKDTVVISIAREKDAHAAKREAKEILDQIGSDGNNVEIRVDETLIGGWRLEGRGALVDASFKKSLLDMYNRAVR